MSLPVFDTQGTLFGSLASVGAALFGEDDRFKLFAQKIWPHLAAARPALAECYRVDNGRPALEPVVMLGVVIFQFLERTPDRQTAELVKYHLGWKLALNLELGAKSFHPTSLVEFRRRLLEHDKARLAFEVVLGALQAEGLVPRKGRQRLDSTHVLGLVAEMSKLESMRETIRLALIELAGELGEERPDFWALIWERYVEHKLDYRSADAVLKEKHQQAGHDAHELLQWLEPLPAVIRDGRQASLLREVFGQYYVVSETKPTPVKSRPPGAIQNPHDPEAKWSAKGKGKEQKTWVGYKVQVAESIGPRPTEKNEPMRNFLTSVVTQEATASEDAGMKATLQAQADMGLERPTELLVDAGYVSAEAIVEAHAEGCDLVGPAKPSRGPEGGNCAEDFEVNVEERRAVCPAGHNNAQCSRLVEQATGKVCYRFEWGATCIGCALSLSCTGKENGRRTLVVGEHHTALQARRKEQKTEEFTERMHDRNAIEGTHSELVRGHGQRRARYRGLDKPRSFNKRRGFSLS